MGFQFQSISSVSDHLSNELGFSQTEIGALIGFFIFPGIVLAFPSGWLGRWVKDKVIVSAGLLLLFIGGLIVLLYDDFILMGIGRTISGLGFVLATVYFTKMAIDWFQGSELSTALGILIVSFPGGVALSQLTHPPIALNFSWQWAIFTTSAFCLVAAFAIAILYQTSNDKTPENPIKSQESYLTKQEWIGTSIAAWSWSFYNAGYLIFLSFSVRALEEVGLPSSEAANTAGLASLLVMIAILSGAILSDRLKISRSVILLSSTVGTLSLLTLPLGYFPVASCLLFGLIGMASGGIVIALSGQSMAPQRRAYGMGVYQTWFFLISAPAPLVGGWLYDITGTAAAAMTFGALLFLMSAIFYFTFLKINSNTQLTQATVKEQE
jgi:predicted MFS family arabinose efflux permease